VAAWATNVAGLSTSRLMVSVPAVEISASRFVSVRFFWSAERPRSLVPRMLMVTAVSVPSALAHRERVPD